MRLHTRFQSITPREFKFSSVLLTPLMWSGAGPRSTFWLFLTLPTSRIRAALVREFYSEEPGLKKCALWGFIHLDFFPLERAALSVLINGGDQRLAALSMVYLSRASPEDSIRILREALHSSNPRMREYACDEIGDRDIDDLKNEMRTLLGDADTGVAEAAASNL